MKHTLKAICALTLLLISTCANAATFDAVNDYSCTETIAGTWSMEGYRAGDGEYLSMVFGHAPLSEVSKYGVDAFYLPDGEQPYYPFFSKFGDALVCSPATKGKAYDAVITWTAQKDGDAVISGTAVLMGSMSGNSEGKKVRASVVSGGKEIWAADVTGGAPGEFKAGIKVSAGDKVRLHIKNAGDPSGNITAVNLHVETSE